MKKFMCVIAICMASVISFAADKSYEVVTTTLPSGATEIRLNILENCSLWMSYFVSNWRSVTDLGYVMDMSEGSYGATRTDGSIKTAGTGESRDLIYSSPDGSKSVAAKGYFLGDFHAGETIGIWVSTFDGETGTSVGDLGSGINSDMVMRDAGLTDLAGNTRFAFEFNSGTVDFIIGGAAPMGQPLPGVLVSLLMGGGLCGGMTYLRKYRKRG